MTIKITDDGLRRRLEKFGHYLEHRLRADVDRVVTSMKGVMDSRISKGQGPNGSITPPYSKQYAKFKKSKGRNTGFVDMTFTGKMLGAMAVRTVYKNGKNTIESNVGWLNPNSDEAKKARGNLRTRQFFGFTKNEETEIRNRIKDKIRP